MAASSSLTDNFNTIDSAKWNNAFSSNIVVVAEELNFTTTLLSNYFDLISQTTYDLTGSFIFAQLINAGNQSLSSLEAIIYVKINDNNKLYIDVSGNFVQPRKIVSGVNTTVGSSVAYNASTMKFLRIREASGTIFFDYSADASSWTNISSVANPFVITAVLLALQVGTFSTELSTTTVIWDNFNIGTADSAPTVTDSAASSITDTSAVGSGNVSSDGGTSVTERGIVWATSSNPTTSNSKQIVSGTTGTFNGAITGLTPGTTYHYRAYASNNIGTSYGADQSFSTATVYQKDTPGMGVNKGMIRI